MAVPPPPLGAPGRLPAAPPAPLPLQPLARSRSGRWSHKSPGLGGCCQPRPHRGPRPHRSRHTGGKGPEHPGWPLLTSGCGLPLSLPGAAMRWVSEHHPLPVCLSSAWQRQKLRPKRRGWEQRGETEAQRGWEPKSRERPHGGRAQEQEPEVPEVPGPHPLLRSAGKGRTGRWAPHCDRCWPEARALPGEAGPLTRAGGSGPSEWASSQPLTLLPAALPAEAPRRA